MPKDVVEPPKFITARHVAGIFEKLGFDASCGQKVFGVLCEAVARTEGENALTEGGYEEDCGDDDSAGTLFSSFRTRFCRDHLTFTCFSELNVDRPCL